MKMAQLLLVALIATLAACSTTTAPDSTAAAASPAPEPAQAPPFAVLTASLDLAAGTLSKVRNISRSLGYNSQPAFVDDGSAVLYVSDRSGSINVYRYEFADGKTTAVTATRENIYSPRPLSDGSGFSAIRVVTPNANGAEDKAPPLWRFGWDGKPIAPLYDVKSVGYYALVSSHLAAFFIVDGDAKRNAHTAVLADRVTGKTTLLTGKPGRSLGRSPDGKRATFVDKTDPQHWVIAAMGPGDEKPIVLVETLALPPGGKEEDRSEDYCWLPDGSLLMASGGKFFRWDGKPGSGFALFADVGELGGEVRRIAVSRDGTRLAFAVQLDVNPR
jgi:hypothetical protein